MGRLATLLFLTTGVGAQGRDAASSPGLYEPDGTPHELPVVHAVTGATLDVTEFGAVPDDGVDDAAAIRVALSAAAPGDEVFVPAGVYDLVTVSEENDEANVSLRSGVNLRGASMGTTTLMSHDDDEDATVILGAGVQDVRLSDFTVTSAWEGEHSADPEEHNPDAGGVSVGIHLEYAGDRMVRGVTIDAVRIEKFRKAAVKLTRTRDVVLQNCEIADATDVGPGGAGYGVLIEGTYLTPREGFPDDSVHNVVQDCHIAGPYVRHGVLLQTYTHNDVVRDNVIEATALDAVDLHGEDEYLNEIYGNTITGVTGGAAIGLGNSGGSTYVHSSTGPRNDLHDNTLTGCRFGIRVQYATPDTLIERNVIHDGLEDGVHLGNAPRTIVQGNVISDNGAEDFWAVRLEGDEGTQPDEGGVGPGTPDGSVVQNNVMERNHGGAIALVGRGVTYGHNTILANREDFRASMEFEGAAADADTVPPAAPTGLEAIARSPDRATLAWNAVADDTVTRFLVYRDGVLVATTAGQTTATIVNLEGGRSYEVKVRAADGGGNLSQPSEALTLTTPP
jgi:large repetitive protein